MLCLSLLAFLMLSVTYTATQETIAQWVTLEYDWSNEATKKAWIANGSYIPQNCMITGIKVFQNQIFLTVPRWKLGVPATMTKLVGKSTNRPRLQPYPSWVMNTIGQCWSFQYTQSMEIIPQLREMWVIDVGRINIFAPNANQTHCPPKLVILDTISGKVKRTFIFPDNIVSHSANFLNDIVVDPLKLVAYMSNPLERTMIILDTKTGTSKKIHHKSMDVEPNAISVTIDGFTFNSSTPIDGIALSPDFSTLFYCPLSSYSLYSIPTDILNGPTLTEALFDKNYFYHGKRSSIMDGMILSSKSLYFGLMAQTAIARWKIQKDMLSSGTRYNDVTLGTVTNVLQNNVTIQWPDTFAIDESKKLWFTTNRLDRFFTDTMDFSGKSGPNFRVISFYIGETSYLDGVGNGGADFGQQVYWFSISLPCFLWFVNINCAR